MTDRSTTTASTKRKARASDKPQTQLKPMKSSPPTAFERLRALLHDPEAMQRLHERLPSWADEVGGFAFIIIGVLTFSALFNPAGEIAAPLATGLQKAFGVGAYVVALTVVVIGVMLLLTKAGIRFRFNWLRLLGLEIAFISLEGLFHLLSFSAEVRALAREGKGGGYVGWAVSSLFAQFIGEWGAITLLAILFLFSFGLFWGIQRRDIRRALLGASTQLQRFANRVQSMGQTPTVPSIESAQTLLTPARPTAPFTTEPPLTGSVAVFTQPISEPEAPKTPAPPPEPAAPPPPTINIASTKPASPQPQPVAPSSTPAPKTPPPPPQPAAIEAPRPTRININGVETMVPPRPTELPGVAHQPAPSVVEARPAPATPSPSPAVPPRRPAPTVTEAPMPTTNDLLAEITDDEEVDAPSVPQFTTLVINGQVVQTPLAPTDRPAIPLVADGRKPKPNSKRRHFVVDGYHDKIKIGKRPKILPPLELLTYSELKLPSEDEVNLNAQIIENTMLEFEIDADVIDVRVGPAVTQYAVSPIKEIIDDNGETIIIRTRVSKIAALSNDLALALSTKTLRIEAPVPGHSYVGIEVPNREPSVVALRSVLESEVYYNDRKKPLAVPLGRDVSGEPIVIDLATMPHLLIAGTTGSGKSICLRSMLASLVMSNSPDEVRLVVLDPKMVELVQFNGLPHLIGPVETDTERIIGVLRWATREMDRRYKLLEVEKARNITAYNELLGRRRRHEHMPYIVIVVDEIGDLMMMRPDETEKMLTRLAQKARAAGMHLVVATQRPSVDVITGLIKANFPARISFAVAAGVDSRVILDTVGAETLVGKGDMLFLGPDAAGPKRLQGCFVSDYEIDTLVDYWKDWHQGEIDAGNIEKPGIPPWEQALTRLESLNEMDPVLEEALSLVVAEGKASVSLIQRRLGVGYPRAARLMDSLHELGIIGSPQAGGKTREVLVKSVEEARRMVQNNRRKNLY
ncbi:MAG: DNA translocase FtsK 4TM domain-containing protein [Anaerolineales bacterium]|nr:DNA translocase FtsK 4TM domain-containing protein [Anaerolineales bacterium]